MNVALYRIIDRVAVIIDDDPALLEYYSEILMRNGMIVHSVTEPDFDSLLALNPDIVLLDLVLHNGRSIPLLRRFHETCPELPVIIISGMGTMQDVIETHREGAWDFIVKGTEDLTGLPLSIERVLEISDLRKANRDYRDKLERHLSETFRELTESQDLFNLFIDFLPGVAYIKDSDSKYILANRFLREMVGSDDLTGATPEDLYPAEVAPLVHEEDRKVLSNGFIRLYDSTFDKDGTERWFDNYKFVIPGPTATYIGGIALDITENRILEARLNRLAQAVEQTGESFVITDEHDVIQYVNAAFERISGYSRSEVIGKRPSILRSGHHDAAFYDSLHQTIRSGKVWHGHFTNRRKNGTLFQEEATIAPVRDHNGTITSYIAVKRDVTEETRLQEQLRQAQKMEAIGTLAGGIAHDFNNILAIMMGFTEMALTETKEGTSLHNDLNEIQKAGQRAKDLVQHILTFSRQRESSRVPICIAPIVKEAVRLLRASIPSSITIEQKVTAQGIVLADAIQIHQIVINLCTNAYHAMRETGGLLRVELTDTVEFPEDAPESWQKAVCLKITDTGHGISPEVQARMFEPYFTTKPQNVGTGMGLAIVHGIINTYGGLIRVNSEIGRGSIFTLYFPVEEEEAPLGKLTGESKSSISDCSILLVDDESSLAKITAQSLYSQGYRVKACTRPEDAWNLFLENPDEFDILITDMTMPGMNGLQLISKIKQIRNDIPVILCTGYSELIDPERIHAQGIDTLLLKPVQIDRMTAAIEECIRLDTQPDEVHKE
jgi:PAS domain S-box-containing protein